LTQLEMEHNFWVYVYSCGALFSYFDFCWASVPLKEKYNVLLL